MPTFTNENPEHVIAGLSRKVLDLKTWIFKDGFDNLSEISLGISFNVMQNVNGKTVKKAVPSNPPSISFDRGIENNKTKRVLFRFSIDVPDNCESIVLRIDSSYPFEVFSPIS
ncbi:MAG TPA: hypothetical protein VI757_12085 [Bacteroidia bacterium]|nr:hypothetical protein [Bacteroidia bacterium]